MDDKLSSSLEDYLETIYLFIKKNNSVKAIDVSRALSVSRASTTEALKKLCEKKLINYGRYDAISITKKGEITAKNIIEKHNSLYEFFKYVLGAADEESHENACKIEHIISQDILTRIQVFTKYCRKYLKEDFKKIFDK